MTTDEARKRVEEIRAELKKKDYEQGQDYEHGQKD